MTIEQLLNIPLCEEELVTRVTELLQQEWDLHQSEYISLDLMRTGEIGVGNGTTQIHKINRFFMYEDLANYVWNREFMYSKILFRFEEGRYTLLLQGYEFSIGLFIHKDHVEVEHKYIKTCHFDDVRMPPLDLIAGAFSEMTLGISTKKGHMPV